MSSGAAPAARRGSGTAEDPPGPAAALDTLAAAGLVVPSAAHAGLFRLVGPHVGFRNALETALTDAHAALGRVTELSSTFADFSARYRESLHAHEAGEVFALAGLDDVVTAANEFADSAEHELSVMSSGRTDGQPCGAVWDVDVVSRAADVNVRVLYPQACAGHSAIAERVHDLESHGGQVRLLACVPTTLLLVDHRVALVTSDSIDPARGAFLVHGAGLVQALECLFEYAWLAADPLEPTTPVDPACGNVGGLTDGERRLLMELAAGYKDESIARHMGLSVRTLRRLIAGLTERAGVSSRFALAVEAQRRGWLLTGSSPAARR